MKLKHREILLLLAIFIGFCGICFVLLERPITEWDGYYIWFPRYLLIRYGQSAQLIRDLNFAQGAYPFLGPSLWAWVEIPSVSFQIGRVGFVVVYLCVFGYSIEKKATIGVLLFAAFGLVLFRSKGIINGYQDEFLMLVFCGALLAWVDAVKQNSVFKFVEWLPIVLIKNEGAILFCMLGASSYFSTSDRKKLFFPSLVGIVGLGFWPLLRTRLQMGAFDVQGGSFDLSQLLTFNAVRLKIIGSSYWSFIRAAKWQLLPLAMLLLNNPLRRRYWLLPCGCLAYGILVFAIFYTTTQPLEWHLATAFDRVISHVIAFSIASYMIIATDFCNRASV